MRSTSARSTKRTVPGAPMTQDEYRRGIAEAWRALESKVCMPSLSDYLDAIRPLWREAVPIPVQSAQRSGNGPRKRWR